MGCGVGVSRSSVENFLPHSAEIFCRGTLQCFINFGYRKTLCLWGEYHDFLLKICCLTVPKIFVGEPFCVSQKFLVSKKFMDKRGGEYHDFLSKVFCLTVPKNFVGEPFSVSLISGIERFYASESFVTIFCWIFFVSQCRNFSLRTRLCFREFLVAKTFMPMRGRSRFSMENLFSHSTEKLRRWTLLCFTKFLVSKKFMYKRGGGVSRFFVKSFFVSQCRKISLRNPSDLCFRKCPVAKKFMDKRGEGVSRLSVENFLPHSAENFCRGTLQCFINFGYRKTLCLWREYHDFLWKICSLTVPKNFVG